MARDATSFPRKPHSYTPQPQHELDSHCSTISAVTIGATSLLRSMAWLFWSTWSLKHAGHLQ